MVTKWRLGRAWSLEKLFGRKPCRLGDYGLEDRHKYEFKHDAILICLRDAGRNSLSYRTLEARMTGLEPATSGVTGRSSVGVAGVLTVAK